jgi:hypothetical protein
LACLIYLHHYYSGKAWIPREKVALLDSIPSPFVVAGFDYSLSSFLFGSFPSTTKGYCCSLLSFYLLWLCRLLSFLGQSSSNAVDKLHSRFLPLPVTGSPAFLSLPTDKNTRSLSQISQWFCHSCCPVLRTQLTNGTFHRLMP